MDKYISLFLRVNPSDGLVLMSLIAIAILLLKINSNIKDLKEYFSIGITLRNHDKKKQNHV